jgi:cytochrome c-type protein NapB
MKQPFARLGLIFVLSSGLLASMSAGAEENIATLRNGPISEEADPPRISRTNDSNERRTRNYPMQPPMIPHKIDGYQVDMNANQCMACHSRRNVQESRAAMVSVTHYMDRDGNFLASISPRRYFCQQCHVTQTDAQPLVANDFVDIDDLLSETPAATH